MLSVLWFFKEKWTFIPSAVSYENTNFNLFTVDPGQGLRAIFVCFVVLFYFGADTIERHVPWTSYWWTPWVVYFLPPCANLLPFPDAVTTALWDTNTSCIGIPHSNDIRLLFDLTEPLTYPHCLYSLSKRDFFIFFLSDPQQPSYRAQTKTQKTKTKTKKPTTVFQPLAPVSADLVQEVRWSVKDILKHNCRLHGTVRVTLTVLKPTQQEMPAKCQPSFWLRATSSGRWIWGKAVTYKNIP